MFRCAPESVAVKSESSDILYAEVWFEFDGLAFPASNWFDFALPITEWWRKALTGLTMGARSEFIFMDGPYRIIARPVNSMVKVEGLRDNQVQIAGDTSLSEFKDSLHNVINELASSCTEKGFTVQAASLSRLLKYFEK